MDGADRERFAAFLLRMRAAGLDRRELMAAIEATPRSSFIPAQWWADTWSDRSLPIECGEAIEGLDLQVRALAMLDLQPGCRVLEIGTGSGFMAALLGHRAQRVLTLEIDNELAQTAHANLQRAGAMNVEVRCADGASADLSAHGPFDVIVLSGSVAELPERLLALLKPGGRLMGIVGDEPVMRATLVHHAGQGLVVTQPWDTNAPRLLGFPEPERFRF